MRRVTPTVSYGVTGLGAAVSTLGWFLRPSAFGYGVLGFGLAHIALGLLGIPRIKTRQA